jgi:hypothetical protein
MAVAGPSGDAFRGLPEESSINTGVSAYRLSGRKGVDYEHNDAVDLATASRSG